ncbi:D-alanyl-lipoteichoic acid biosynthesis protein DltD [Vagococcus xieshaowenii]|nr:D-alanyl-lipoteichoic acid biosynthesis protein DltD [Vagococcus xieshaowenii]
MAIGPLMVAICLVIVLLFSPFKWTSRPSEKAIHQSASSMSINVIKGNSLKNTAMGTGKYLPFFGSSELSRINALHPSVLAQKYQRDYEPFLLGAPGTQSLAQFLMIQSMGKELTNKQVVFIISPQWFVKEGVSDAMFSLYYSPLQTYQWVLTHKEDSEASRYTAQRLLDFSSVKSDTLLNKVLQKMADGEELSSTDIKGATFQHNLFSQEDHLFSKFAVRSKQKRIDKAEKQLPNVYNDEQLDQLAVQLGSKNTSNNPYQISNKFYDTRIAPVESSLENSQKKFNYLNSPEYADFQLVLNQMAKENIKPLFVIPPVNKKWSDYTGVSQEMLKDFSIKIKQQLTSQGFKTIADYTDQNDVDYFMEDTIHLGWRGWLALDEDLQAFLKTNPSVHYEIDNDRYLTTDWQEYHP